MLVQVQTPDEVFVLPFLSQTRELHIHNTVVLEQVTALAEEGGELLDTDVFSHLQLGDLVVLGILGDITVVKAQDVTLRWGDTGLTKDIVTPGGLVFGDGETSSFSSVVYAGKLGESTPAAADVEKLLALLESDLLAHDGHLVILHLLEGLLTGGVRDETTGVHHAGAKEEGIVVITLVVCWANLVQVLRSGVEEDIGEEVAEKELEGIPGEAEIGPVVAVFKDLENIAVERGASVEVLPGEQGHGDLVVALPFCLVRGVFE